MDKFVIRQNEKIGKDNKFVLQLPKFLANNNSWTKSKSGHKVFSEKEGLKHIKSLDTKFKYKLQAIK